MARRPTRDQRTRYRRHETFMARINEATTPKTRILAAKDYLLAAIDGQDVITADLASRAAATDLAELARRITMGENL